MDAARLLEEKCREFSVEGSVVQIHPGPVVTTFEFKPDANQTVVTWSMGGKQNFLEKAMCIVMNGKKMIGDEMDKGLAKLKTVAESGTSPAPSP